MSIGRPPTVQAAIKFWGMPYELRDREEIDIFVVGTSNIKNGRAVARFMMAAPIVPQQ